MTTKDMTDIQSTEQSIPLENESGMIVDAWTDLRVLTDARIAIGRAGVSTPTQAQLAFNLDHALARDAVNVPLDYEQLSKQLENSQLSHLRVRSQASDRRVYLQRPDLGRCLTTESRQLLQQHSTTVQYDVAVLLVDGLSSTAVQVNGAALAHKIAQRCEQAGYSISPIVLVEQGRVAIGDDIGEALGAKSVVLIVGERPGLSSPDSLGIYYTYAPRKGLTDARRNCISNIRSAGLTNEQAANRLMWLINESHALAISGVELKDHSMEVGSESGVIENVGNFLLPKSRDSEKK